MESSWKSLHFTNDPLSVTLHENIKHAQKVGLLKSTDVSHLFDLTLLNQVLTEVGESTVKAT